MRSRSCLCALILSLFLCTYLATPGNSWGNSRRSLEPLAPAERNAAPANSSVREQATIPGPLSSFDRMAAISQQVPPQDVLPLFALNVYMHGYGRSRKNQRGGKPTEYLLLIEAYLRQAHALQALAGPTGVIRVSQCETAKPLLNVLGYRLRQPCGPNASLETANPQRAFLTVDSGFPLTRLEDALRGGVPFTYSYPSTRLPVLFTPADWTSQAKGAHVAKNDVIDALLKDPVLARTYWAMSQLESQTRGYLEQSVGIRNLIPYAPVLDYYGRGILIRSDRVVVPGGPAADAAWQGLVGASPREPATFIRHLLKKDNGWLAAYYDALSRVSPARQTYFTEPARLKTFYRALLGNSPRPGPAHAVFRTDPGLLLLVSQVQLDRNGQPHVPGNLLVWEKALQVMKTKSKIVRKWARHARGWKNPQDMLAAMFTFSRASGSNGPLQMYLMLSAIDRSRSPGERLSPQTVRLLIDNFSRFHDQYLLFSEFPRLTGGDITLFIRTARDIDRVRSPFLRTNAVGIFQAEIGLWRILARQGEIRDSALGRSFRQVIHPFAGIRTAPQLFDAGRTSFEDLCRAATGQSGLTQDEFIALLAGPKPKTPLAAQVRRELAGRIRAVMGDQRLVSTDTLFALADGLNEMAHGEGKSEVAALLPLAKQLHQFEMPRPIFSSRQIADWSLGVADNKNTKAQERTDLRKIIETHRSPRILLAARGLLCPFLRDSLVGLNYAYFEPPGAEMIRNDAFFIRAHDFSGAISTGGGNSWQTSFLVGRGWTSGVGAHLAGSLAGLPYVLANAEQGFIVPRNTQALVWRDMVPTLLIDAVVPRWWGISPDELHAVALYQRAGEELMAASAGNGRLRAKVMAILSVRMMPARAARIDHDLRSGRVSQALSQTTPADTFYLTAGFRSRFPLDTRDWGPAGKELQALARRDPGAVKFARLSKDFGVPHPALALTYARQLLDTKLFPTCMGYSSQLLGESWDSDNLYWARLADEAGYAPVMLNLLVPRLTRAMIVNIFATYTGDWPALLRALRQTGEQFRRGQIPSIPKPKARRATLSATEPRPMR